MNTDNAWTIEALRTHLQSAVDLEFWTIPFYLAPMYSIVDRSSEAYQLIQSVVHQEMLHVQLAANIANASGIDKVMFPPPHYGKCDIPHLRFGKDSTNLRHRDPTLEFNPWSSEIGPLDEERINAMCLIEYTEWGELPPGELHQHVLNYGSIGEFYQALKFGGAQHKREIKGGRRQVDWFGGYYAEFKQMKVTKSRKKGWKQVKRLMSTIVEQGEGQSERHSEIPPKLRNTADDPAAVIDHFDKFIAIREGGDLPAVYPAVITPENEDQQDALRVLQKNFKQFRGTLENLFCDNMPADNFQNEMVTLGGNILTCWQRGVVPAFTEPTEAHKEDQP